MDFAEPSPWVAAFTEELLRTGVMLSELGADLIEALPPDAYPNEDPAHVFLEMVTGTIHCALVEADRRDVERATDLIVEARERVLEHLQLALELQHRDGRSTTN